MSAAHGDQFEQLSCQGITILQHVFLKLKDQNEDQLEKDPNNQCCNVSPELLFQARNTCFASWKTGFDPFVVQNGNNIILLY